MYSSCCRSRTLEGVYDSCGCETGQSKITGAYNLPCKYVIHTVGPVFMVMVTSLSCWFHAIRLHLTLLRKRAFIAFPCISTGVYGYPKAEAA